MKSIITLIAILMASSTLNAGQINIANASLKIVEISISAKECLDNRRSKGWHLSVRNL
ncbi:MAG: hypothetical protein R2827_15065 [Bdellovibrionales bacterium]